MKVTPIRSLSEYPWRTRKQAEFLVERSFPWGLVRRIGVLESGVHNMTMASLRSAEHRPEVTVEPRRYY